MKVGGTRMMMLRLLLLPQDIAVGRRRRETRSRKNIDRAAAIVLTERRGNDLCCSTIDLHHRVDAVLRIDAALRRDERRGGCVLLLLMPQLMMMMMMMNWVMSSVSRIDRLVMVPFAGRWRKRRGDGRCRSGWRRLRVRPRKRIGAVRARGDVSVAVVVVEVVIVAAAAVPARHHHRRLVAPLPQLLRQGVRHAAQRSATAVPTGRDGKRRRRRRERRGGDWTLNRSSGDCANVKMMMIVNERS